MRGRTARSARVAKAHKRELARRQDRDQPKATVVRHRAVVAGFLVALLGLTGRAGYLMVTERDFLKRQGDARSVREVPIAVHRGMIFDRNGEPLAVSAPMAKVWIDPSQTTLDDFDLRRLGAALELDAARLTARIAAGSPQYANLARRVPPNTASRVESLDIEGVRIGRDYHRFYPAGETVAHVVGRTNVDDVGQEGVELMFNDFLAGVPGVKRILQDRKRQLIKNLGFLRMPEFGEDLHLSLDLRLQFLAYWELKAAVERNGASSGSLVMLDAASGEILALANLPSFNPNDWPNRGVAGVRNRAVADVYEPGSTVKPFAVLAAIESGAYQPDTEIDTAPGYFRVGRKTIEDPLDRGRISVATVLAKSSQVGIAKIALSLPEYAVFDALQQAGFGDLTGSGLPGEAIGELRTDDLDKPIGRATLAYGYGLTVSPLQLARAYLALAAGGVRRDLTILRGAVVREDVAFREPAVATVTDMMRGVLEPGGTAPKGRPAGYTAAGKTGTARKVGTSGYDDRSHVAFFAGFAPASAPRIVLVVVVNEPRAGLIGGGAVAAPIFARVAERALRVLGVPPDDAASLPGELAVIAPGGAASHRPQTGTAVEPTGEGRA